MLFALTGVMSLSSSAYPFHATLQVFPASFQTIAVLHSPTANRVVLLPGRAATAAAMDGLPAHEAGSGRVEVLHAEPFQW